MVTDAKDTKTDAVPEKGGGSEDKGQKDSPQPKVYTEDEAEKKFSSQRSTLDKKVTGLEKSLETATKRATDAEAREVERLTTADEKELEAAEGDKEQLTAIQQRQRNRKDRITNEAEAKRLEIIAAEQQAEIDTAKATQFDVKVKDIAAKYELKADTLKDLGITDLEQLEKVAKAMSTKEGTGPDSGKDMGGGVGDAEFVKGFASGAIPVTQANIDRYKNTLKE